MEVALDRDALYYPYIHIRDANWLKATLLSFPQVRRIVPEEFSLNDLPDIKPFREVAGARNEPLLVEEPAYLSSVDLARKRLRSHLEGLPPELLSQYSRKRVSTEYKDPNTFQMHHGKLDALLDFLKEHDLAWPARTPSVKNQHEWYALHPTLGEIVMSVIAIAIAQEKGLDIVTSSGRVHRALASLDEGAVLAPLSEAPVSAAKSQTPTADMVDELCQVVMLTSFDLSKLTAEDIAALQKDGKDLRRFKTELIKIASSIPDMPDPTERDKRLKAAAKEVRSEWQEYRKSLPRFAVDALLSAAAWKPPELIATSLAGAASATVLSGGAGLVIALGVYAGFGVWRGYKEKTSSPYQFLSRIEGAAPSLGTRPVATRRLSVL